MSDSVQPARRESKVKNRRRLAVFVYGVIDKEWKKYV